MIYAAIIVGFVVSHLASAWMYGRAIQNVQREHDRRVDLLINQILHLTGKTWTPPPAEQWQPPVVDEDRGRYVAVPEQMPDDEDWERDR